MPATSLNVVACRERLVAFGGALAEAREEAAAHHLVLLPPEPHPEKDEQADGHGHADRKHP